MFGFDFQNDLLQKHVVLFGTMFNDIKITRSNANNVVEQTFTVPLGYGPRDHWLARVEGDPGLSRPEALLLPRIAYEIVDLNYNPKRKLPSTQDIVNRGNIVNKVAYNKVKVPVPYDITFRLSIISKTVEDGAKIVTQILPFFKPDMTITAHLLDSMPDYNVDIPITLKSVKANDTYNEAWDKRRVISWDMDFVMGGYLYGPETTAKIIKIATVNFITGNNAAYPIESIQIRPGLTANGEPTTVAADSVPVSQIEADDNYGYIVTITNFYDE